MKADGIGAPITGLLSVLGIRRFLQRFAHDGSPDREIRPRAPDAHIMLFAAHAYKNIEVYSMPDLRPKHDFIPARAGKHKRKRR